MNSHPFSVPRFHVLVTSNLDDEVTRFVVTDKSADEIKRIRTAPFSHTADHLIYAAIFPVRPHDVAHKKCQFELAEQVANYLNRLRAEEERARNSVKLGEPA